MANDLTTTPDQQLAAARIACNGLSAGLRSLLELGDTTSAVEQLAQSPVLLSEARLALPALTTVATYPAGPAGVRRVLGKALVMFRLDMSDPEWAIWWADHIELLGDLPEAALEAGMRAHKLTPDAEFMPKAGRLRALAVSSVNRPTQAADRARAALKAADKPPEMVTPVSRETVERMMADYRAKVVRPEIRPERTSWGAPPQTDGDGISPALRKVMAERVQDNG